MLSLNGILIALGGVLAVVVALHVYAHWSIRNIDRDTEAKNTDAILRRSDPTTRTGDISAIPVRVKDVARRQR